MLHGTKKFEQSLITLLVRSGKMSNTKSNLLATEIINDFKTKLVR